MTGNGQGATWGLTETKLSEYLETYPGVDRAAMLAELRKARQWCRDNPARQKTPRGMPRFLSNWLRRAQDGGGIGSGPSNRGAGGGKAAGPRTSSGGRWPYPDAAADFADTGEE